MPSPLPKSRSRRTRFYPMLIGRAAWLFKKGIKPVEVARYFLKQYGVHLRIDSLPQMMDFLFRVRQGRRPNFQKLFEGKTPNQIKAEYHSLVNAMKKNQAQMKARRTTPAFMEKQKNTLKAKWKDPTWREKTTRKLIQGHQKRAARKKRNLS